MITILTFDRMPEEISDDPVATLLILLALQEWSLNPSRDLYYGIIGNMHGTCSAPKHTT